MPAPAACLDECTHLDLVDALRRRGFSVTSLPIVGPRGADDEVVVDRATALGCILITHNTDDFKVLHATFARQGREHDWLGTQRYASRLFRWSNLQRQRERGFRHSGYSEDETRHALGQD